MQSEAREPTYMRGYIIKGSELNGTSEKGITLQVPACD